MSTIRIDNKNIEEYFSNMRRCAKCILPETFPGIEFDEDGVCNYCRTYEPVKVFGEEKLKERLEEYRNRGKKYDCIVAISGGRDSSFVLYNMVEKYDMRVLALTVDSGAITPEGYRNIKTITESLGVDHVWIRDEAQIKTAKENTKIKFHAWLKKPSIHTIVPTLNAGDKTMNLRIYKYADRNGIPLVIGGNIIGNSSFEQEHFKTGFLGVFPDNRGNYSTPDKIKLSILFAVEHFKSPCAFHLSILREYLEGAFVYFFESILKPRSVDTLGFFDYIYWDEKEILSTIYKLGWEGASDATTTWRIDDAAYPLINYLYYNLVGFTEHDEMYSKMIREGQISRQEGLKRCMSDHHYRIPYMMKTLEELRVSKEEIDKVLEEYRKKLLSKVLRKHYERVIIE